MPRGLEGEYEPLLGGGHQAPRGRRQGNKQQVSLEPKRPPMVGVARGFMGLCGRCCQGHGWEEQCASMPGPSSGSTLPMLYPCLRILSHLPHPCTVAHLLILWLIPSLPPPASLPGAHLKVPTSALMAEPGQT